MALKEKPPAREGLSVLMVPGEDHLNGSLQKAKTQPTWERARELERDSRTRAITALAMRGTERLQALAVASALGFAARDAGLMAGGVQ